MKIMYYLYLLLCKDGSVYTGITTDVGRRFLEHVRGAGAHYTASRGAKKIVYIERCATRSAAARREAEIKKWKRERKLVLIRSIKLASA